MEERRKSNERACVFPFDGRDMAVAELSKGEEGEASWDRVSIQDRKQEKRRKRKEQDRKVDRRPGAHSGWLHAPRGLFSALILRHAARWHLSCYSFQPSLRSVPSFFLAFRGLELARQPRFFAFTFARCSPRAFDTLRRAAVHRRPAPEPPYS